MRAREPLAKLLQRLAAELWNPSAAADARAAARHSCLEASIGGSCTVQAAQQFLKSTADTRAVLTTITHHGNVSRVPAVAGSHPWRAAVATGGCGGGSSGGATGMSRSLHVSTAPAAGEQGSKPGKEEDGAPHRKPHKPRKQKEGGQKREAAAAADGAASTAKSSAEAAWTQPSAAAGPAVAAAPAELTESQVREPA